MSAEYQAATPARRAVRADERVDVAYEQDPTDFHRALTRIGGLWCSVFAFGAWLAFVAQRFPIDVEDARVYLGVLGAVASWFLLAAWLERNIDRSMRFYWVWRLASVGLVAGIGVAFVYAVYGFREEWLAFLR